MFFWRRRCVISSNTDGGFMEEDEGEDEDENELKGEKRSGI